MVTFLITSVVILGLFAIALYFWQKPARKPEPIELPPPPAASLFAYEEPAQLTERPEQSTSAEPSSTGSSAEPAATQDTPNDEHRARIAAAGEFIESWKDRPDRTTTAKMLHLAAVADDAETYNNAAELALNFWQGGRLPDVSAAELQSLLTSEFWLLSSRTRSSGAGFVLKRTLSRAKRELESANNSN
jgi:hypothetical protein